MSRHGYDDDYGYDDPWGLIRYRGAVTSAIRGKRGQTLLRRLRASLDEMADKRLVAEVLVGRDGSCCAFGSVAKREGIDVSDVEGTEDAEAIAAKFDVAPALAREVMFVNDDHYDNDHDMVYEQAHYIHPTDPRKIHPYHFDREIPFEERAAWTLIESSSRRPTEEDVARRQHTRWTRVSKWVDQHLKKENP